jgi:hypothetical protein
MKRKSKKEAKKEQEGAGRSRKEQEGALIN